MTDGAFVMISKGVFIVVMIIIIMYLVMPDMYYKHVDVYMPKDPDSVIRTVQSSDARFNELLENVHYELRKLVVEIKGDMCKTKKAMLQEIDNYVDGISEDLAKKICSKSEWKKSKGDMISIIPMSFLLPPSLHKSLSNLLSYVVPKYFCKKGILNKDVLKTYLKDILNGLCSDSSPMVGFFTYNGKYLINTPLSYIKM